MLKELVATALLSGSIGLKSNVPVTVPYHDLTRSAVDYERSPTIVQGVYNFRDFFNYTEFLAYANSHGYDDDISSTVQFDHVSSGGMPVDRFNTPLSYSGTTYYLYKLDLAYSPNDYILVTFYCYNGSQGADLEFTFELYEDTYLSSFISTYSYLQELLFEFHEDVGFTREEGMIFDFFFTRDNNSFITTYNGYFTWSSLTSYNRPVTCFGTSLFGSSMYYDLVTPQQNGATSWDNAYYFSVDFSTYEYSRFILEGSQFPLQNYNKTWLVNWKMSNNTKSKLELYGVFQYVPDHTYDDVTFKDFFFSIVDTPVYFVSSILSFELFGVNLFIALSGLLTICVILVLIKKFW